MCSRLGRICLRMGHVVTAVTKTGRTQMGGNELIVAFFALAFLAFCLTAVALYALSRDKDDVADKSVSGLNKLRWGSLTRPKYPDVNQDDLDSSDSPPE